MEQWTSELKELLSKGESEFINVLHRRTMVQAEVHSNAHASQARRKRNKVCIALLPLECPISLHLTHVTSEIYMPHPNTSFRKLGFQSVCTQNYVFLCFFVDMWSIFTSKNLKKYVSNHISPFF
jgi:hypothetical protein